MSLGKIQKIIDKLARHFKIRPPKVHWFVGSQRSWYYPEVNIIALNLRDDPIHVALHEFSHSLQYERGGSNHDLIFWESLWEVLIFYYKGKPEKHQWKYEYKIGQKFYSRKQAQR